MKFHRLRSFFWTTVIGGIVVVLPISILVIGVRFVWRVLETALVPVKELFNFGDGFANWMLDLMSLAIVVAAFFLIGLIVRTELGKKLIFKLERRWLSPIPLYNTIRDTVQQFTGARKMPFSQVVLVDVFNTPTRMTGFITEELVEGRYTVFVPTGPNPTNGFIFHVEKSQLEFVDTKPEDAMRTIIGVGTGSSILFMPPVVSPKRAMAEQES